MIQKVLQEKSIENYTTLNNDFAYVLDLDKNGTEDKIISVSNQTEEENTNQYFTLLLIVLNGNVHTIYQEDSLKSNGFVLPYYSYMEAIKIGNQTKIVVNKSYFNNAGSPSTILLDVSDNKITEETIGE
mgnify:FL=1